MEPEQDLWREPPTQLSLAQGYVHIWRASLTIAERSRHDLWQLLSAEEQARANRLAREQDRQRFLVGHGVLRALLAQYLQVPPAELQFGSGPHGKPYVAGSSGGRALGFSLAHSGGLALVACAWDREVGVDLEEVDSPAIDLSVANRFFAPSETRTILARSPSARPLAFARCWTLKEAYLKATGLGLSQPLDAFAIQLDGCGPRLRTPQGVATEGHWTFRELDAGPGYAAALCVAGTGWELRCWNWNPGERAGPSPTL